MRPTTWVSLLALLLMTAAVSRDLAAAPTPPAATEKRVEVRFWILGGNEMPSEQEAVQDALKAAQRELITYLRSQNPPMNWVPDIDYIKENLLTNIGPSDPTFQKLEWEHPRNRSEKLKNGTTRTVLVETREHAPPLDTMYRAAVRVEVSSYARQDFARQEQSHQESVREHRATYRQKILACVLAGLVALLLAVAGYLRLEDATKGYYTKLLRAAVVVFLALVAAGIFVLRRRL